MLSKEELKRRLHEAQDRVDVKDACLENTKQLKTKLRHQKSDLIDK